MNDHPENGIVSLRANRSVGDVVAGLISTLQEKGIRLFALIDRNGEAKKVGLEMPPTKLLIFGNPRAGTPLMLAAPTIAIDLPLKILVWQEAGGEVWISYNSPAFLEQRHSLPQNLLANIGVVASLAENAAK